MRKESLIVALLASLSLSHSVSAKKVLLPLDVQQRREKPLKTLRENFGVLDVVGYGLYAPTYIFYQLLTKTPSNRNILDSLDYFGYTAVFGHLSLLALRFAESSPKELSIDDKKQQSLLEKLLQEAPKNRDALFGALVIALRLGLKLGLDPNGEVAQLDRFYYPLLHTIFPLFKKYYEKNHKQELTPSPKPFELGIKRFFDSSTLESYLPETFFVLGAPVVAAKLGLYAMWLTKFLGGPSSDSLEAKFTSFHDGWSKARGRASVAILLALGLNFLPSLKYQWLRFKLLWHKGQEELAQKESQL